MLWLVGAGKMSVEYSSVLKSLKCDYLVVGRTEDSANYFKVNTGVQPILGGIDAFLRTNPIKPDHAIVSVSVEKLAEVTTKLILYGVKNILVEKPGGTSSIELERLCACADAHDANVVIAYNRRHYASVRAIKRFIDEDGGVSSLNFDITEWSHVIEKHAKHPIAMHTWFVGNTSHVFDTAFFLAGKPKKLSVFSKGGVSWHPASSNFAGAGITESDALFSYHGDWKAPGRWSIEVSTFKRKYILRPMEELHVQEVGSLQVLPIDVDGAELDLSFKPGLFRQVKCFIENDLSDFCDLHSQVEFVKMYENMAGY